MKTALPLERARRITLGAQGFADPAPSGSVDRRNLRRAMSRLKVLQLDSVPVVARTQHVVLFARLGHHRFDQLDDIAYRHDEWIEAWAHEACLIPVETEPLLRWMKQRAIDGELWRTWQDFVKKEAAYIGAVLEEVHERGPLTAAELSDPRPRDGEWWGSRSLGTVALDWLFRSGRVGIRRRGNFTKVYDTYERIVPEDVRSAPTPSAADAQRALIVQSVEALGVGTVTDIADYFRLPIGEVRRHVADLTAEGVLVERTVGGWSKPGYLVPDVRIPRRIEVNTLLSPFDPVVWCRERASRLFGFDYRIEIYVPRSKRVFGYYVLPWLLGDRLAGRFDLKTDRSENCLRVLGAFAEEGEDPVTLAKPAAEALGRLARFVGVGAVVVDDRSAFGRAIAAAGAER